MYAKIHYSLKNYSYEIRVHIGDYLMWSFDQDKYRTAKNLFGLPIRNGKCRI